MEDIMISIPAGILKMMIVKVDISIILSRLKLIINLLIFNHLLGSNSSNIMITSRIKMSWILKK